MKAKRQAERLRHRQQWGDWSLALAWIINTMPRFAAGFPGVTAEQVNPYTATPIVRGTPLKIGDPEAKSALRSFVERANERARR